MEWMVYGVGGIRREDGVNGMGIVGGIKSM